MYTDCNHKGCKYLERDLVTFDLDLGDTRGITQHNWRLWRCFDNARACFQRELVC